MPDTAGDEEEWEYEYDYDNPEVLYVTVDFSTHAPPGLPGKNLAGGLAADDHRNAQTMNARRPRKRKRQPTDDDDGVEVVVPSIQASPAAAPPAAAAAPPDPDPDDPSPTTPTIQILDLHARNPLIAYNSRFYTCHWATDLGTTLYLTRPGGGGGDGPPLLALRSVEIQAATRARLVAVPATLRPRVAAGAPPTTTTGPDHHLTIDTAEGDRIEMSAAGQMRVRVPARSSEAKRAQAAFLERWSALKVRRGWGDPIPVKASRGYRLPEGWEEERARWAEVERREREDEEEGAGLVKGRRRRGRARSEGEAGGAREAVVLNEEGEDEEGDA